MQFLVGNISLDLDAGSLDLTSLGDGIDFLSLNVGSLVLLIKLLEEFVGGLSGGVELGILLLEDNLHSFDILSGVSEFVKTFANVLFFPIDGLILGGVKLMIGLDEGEVRLGGDVHVTTHLLEVLTADFIDHLMDLTHVDGKLLFGGSGGVDLDLGQELLRHRDERFFGPWEEPIDGAAREHGGELLSSLSELGIDRGESEDHVEVILHTVEEVLPQDRGRRVFTLLADFLHVDVLALDRDQILVFLAEETWDLTGSKHRVDGFEESLGFDLSVSHQEADRAALGAGNVVEGFDIIEQCGQAIGLGQRNLEELMTADVRGESGKRGLTRATNTDEHSATGRGVHRAGKSEQMGESVIENDEGHLLGRVLLVELIELDIDNVLDMIVA